MFQRRDHFPYRAALLGNKLGEGDGNLPQLVAGIRFVKVKVQAAVLQVIKRVGDIADGVGDPPAKPAGGKQGNHHAGRQQSEGNRRGNIHGRRISSLVSLVDRRDDQQHHGRHGQQEDYPKNAEEKCPAYVVRFFAIHKAITPFYPGPENLRAQGFGPALPRRHPAAHHLCRPRPPAASPG